MKWSRYEPLWVFLGGREVDSEMRFWEWKWLCACNRVAVDSRKSRGQLGGRSGHRLSARFLHVTTVRHVGHATGCSRDDVMLAKPTRRGSLGPQTVVQRGMTLAPREQPR